MAVFADIRLSIKRKRLNDKNRSLALMNTNVGRRYQENFMRSKLRN